VCGVCVCACVCIIIILIYINERCNKMNPGNIWMLNILVSTRHTWLQNKQQHRQKYEEYAI